MAGFNALTASAEISTQKNKCLAKVAKATKENPTGVGLDLHSSQCHQLCFDGCFPKNASQAPVPSACQILMTS